MLLLILCVCCGAVILAAAAGAIDMRPIRHFLATPFRMPSYSIRIPLPAARPADPRPSPAAPSATDAEAREPDARDTESGRSNALDQPEPIASPTDMRQEQRMPVERDRADDRKQPATENPRQAQLASLEYDLRNGSGPSAASAPPEAMEVEKTVHFHGTDAGRLKIRIDRNSRIYARGRQLADMLNLDRSGYPALGEEYASFDELRKAGLDIRYDATRDRLDVSLGE